MSYMAWFIGGLWTKAFNVICLHGGIINTRTIQIIHNTEWMTETDFSEMSHGTILEREASLIGKLFFDSCL